MESSTTKPVQRTSASKVIKFTENPKKFKNINVAIIEIGTVIKGIKDRETFLKKSIITNVTNETANNNVIRTSTSASFTKIDVSQLLYIFILVGRSFLIFSNSCKTPLETDIRLAEVCFTIPKLIISSPFPLNNSRGSSGAISTFAISFIVT